MDLSGSGKKEEPGANEHENLRHRLANEGAKAARSDSESGSKPQLKTAKCVLLIKLRLGIPSSSGFVPVTGQRPELGSNSWLVAFPSALMGERHRTGSLGSRRQEPIRPPNLGMGCSIHPLLARCKTVKTVGTFQGTLDRKWHQSVVIGKGRRARAS